MPTQTCLVLMFKAPQRSKRRLAAEIGAHAKTAAEYLIECALEDLAAWQGPTCLAPAAAPDLQFALNLDYAADVYIDQESGNLGERICHVNQVLIDAGHRDQMFIGIDCPDLDFHYLSRADAAMRAADVVLGPATDGGVVLMGIRGRWPPLGGLPWSTAALRDELTASCGRANLTVTSLEEHRDVDCARDLEALPARLRSDRRPGRQRLCTWIESETFR